MGVGHSKFVKKRDIFHADKYLTLIDQQRSMKYQRQESTYNGEKWILKYRQDVSFRPLSLFLFLS